MRGYYETDGDPKPSHTNEGLEIASHALDGFGSPIITLTDETELTEVTVTVDSVEVPFVRSSPEVEFFTGQTIGLDD